MMEGRAGICVRMMGGRAIMCVRMMEGRAGICVRMMGERAGVCVYEKDGRKSWNVCVSAGMMRECVYLCVRE